MEKFLYFFAIHSENSIFGQFCRLYYPQESETRMLLSSSSSSSFVKLFPVYFFTSTPKGVKEIKFSFLSSLLSNFVQFFFKRRKFSRSKLQKGWKNHCVHFYNKWRRRAQWGEKLGGQKKIFAARIKRWPALPYFTVTIFTLPWWPHSNAHFPNIFTNIKWSKTIESIHECFFTRYLANFISLLCWKNGKQLFLRFNFHDNILRSFCEIICMWFIAMPALFL